MNARRSLITVFALAAALACRADDQRTDTMNAEGAMQERESMPPEVVAQLDSGTQAFRMQDFEGSLRHYQRVTEMAPDVGAGWFGVYMAHDALGNEEEAAAALERAQAIVPEATLIHEDGSSRSP